MAIWKKNLILIILVAVIVSIPLLMYSADVFEGADGLGEDIIAEIDPDYEPWYESKLELSSEVESFLFCLQAAVGSGIVFFILGRMTAPSRRREKDRGENNGNG